MEALLNVAATRTAQANYTRGMAIGTGILIVGSAAVATGLATPRPGSIRNLGACWGVRCACERIPENDNGNSLP